MKPFYSYLTHVKKEGVHPQGWKYPRLSDVYEASRKALQEAGIHLIPRIDRVEQREIPSRDVRGQDRPAFLTTVHMTIEVHTESGIHAVPWVGQAADFGDKSVSKAISFAMKTFLIALLMLPSDEDDPDAGDVEMAAPQQAKPAAPQSRLVGQDTPHLDAIAQAHGMEPDKLKKIIEEMAPNLTHRQVDGLARKMAEGKTPADVTLQQLYSAIRRIAAPPKPANA